jgi:hypothetical protein
MTTKEIRKASAVRRVAQRVLGVILGIIFVLPGSKKVGTRPLCPWPKVAHYNGSGSTTDAASFSCK